MVQADVYSTSHHTPVLMGWQDPSAYPELRLEERVATLEQLVARLLRTTGQGEHPKDWRHTVGMFDGDPIMQEIIREGRRLREEDRRQTRP